MEFLMRDIAPSQRATLVERLEQNGFILGLMGNIYVKNKKPEHPRNTSMFHSGLPVAFVGPDYLALVNTDERFPEDYHGKLKQISESLSPNLKF